MLVSLGLVFGLCELAARAIYPEFARQLHTAELTAGKRRHMGRVLGLNTRLPAEGEEPKLEAGDRVVLVIGDSVANGYGLSYFDTFWSLWQRRLDLGGREEKVITLSGYGNNFIDNIDRITEAIGVFRDRGVELAAVVYQFNFNDLLPVTRADLQQWNEERPWWHMLRKSSGWWLAKLRHELLNRSVFIRASSIKLASVVNELSRSRASCEALGINALGSYSYAFMARGLEEQGARSWGQFHESVETVTRTLKPVPFAIVVSPISPLVHPDLREHHLALPPRMDCATVDPRRKLAMLAAEREFPLCDPIPYLKTTFDRYRREGNTRTFFHENDANHPNELGAYLMGEYCYEHLFQQVGILDSKPVFPGKSGEEEIASPQFSQ